MKASHVSVTAYVCYALNSCHAKQKNSINARQELHLATHSAET